ncbi:MAG: hypothetical protein AB2L18_07415 [Anaerolineaceae bacterium]
MKKLVLSIFILTALLLSACGGKTTNEAESQNLAAPEVSTSSEKPNSSGEPKNQQSGEVGVMDERGVSDLTRLLVGLFKLEETDLVLSKEQATSLIPILNSYLELAQNQNTAPQEQAATPDPSTDAMQQQQTALQEQQTALVEQIEAVLTTDQTNSITSLDLDQEAVMAFLEEQGLSFGGGQPGQGTDQAMPQGTPSADQSGNVPQVQGTPGSGNGGPGGNPQDGSTTMGGQGGSQGVRGGGSNSTSSVLIEALLQLLTAKVNA